MSSVIGTLRNQRKNIPGKPSQVTGMKVLPGFIYEFTDREADADITFAVMVGNSTEDGQPLFLTMEPKMVQELFRVPQAHILKGLRRAYAEMQGNAPVPSSLTDAASDVELGDLNLGEVG